MLVVTQKINEVIQIGDNIAVHILGIDGCQAKVGIIAPKELRVNRSSHYKKLKQPSEKNKPR